MEIKHYLTISGKILALCLGLAMLITGSEFLLCGESLFGSCFLESVCGWIFVCLAIPVMYVMLLALTFVLELPIALFNRFLNHRKTTEEKDSNNDTEEYNHEFENDWLYMQY